MVALHWPLPRRQPAAGLLSVGLCHHPGGGGGPGVAGASAISHDLHARVIMKARRARPRRSASPRWPPPPGHVAALLGMAFEKMNVAFMVALAFGVASCANFPSR